MPKVEEQPKPSPFEVNILPQPDDETCGATCLHAVYKYYGHPMELSQLVDEIETLETGGTMAVALGIHALSRGFRATIYTYNLQMFDPTWFKEGVNISEKIEQQRRIKPSARLQWASALYLRFLAEGGKVAFEELDEPLIHKFIDRGIPMLTGLNATYLYRTPRELNNDYDDIKGQASGHFVVLYGYDKESNRICIADPLMANPFSQTQQYTVGIDTLINSIMLGIVTNDANFLIIEPAEKA